MRIFCFVVFILVAFIIKAQPGGGGGLKIYSILDSSHNKLSIRKNEISVRAFGIEATYGDELSQVSHEIDLKKSDTILLAPLSNLNFGYNAQTSISLRLLFVYNSDTSIVDFNNVIGANGAGWITHVDSLMLNHGYKSYNYVANDSVVVKQKNKIDVSFLNEDKLTQSYYCSKALDAIRLNNNEAAINYLLIAEGKKNKFGVIEKRLQPEINYRLADAYYNVGDYEKFETRAKTAIKLSPTDYEYYKLLIQVQIKLNKLDEASKTYAQALKDVHVPNYDFERIIRNDWALFNIQQTHKYDTVTSVYKKLVEPSEKTYYYPGHKESFRGSYEDYYFMLGLAEYTKGDFTPAYNHWLTAMELGYGSTYYYYSVAHFDSIVKRHPDEAMPNLLNAIALYKSSPYLGSKGESLLNDALINIEKAEKLNINTPSLNFWKAKILFGLRKYSEALEQINTAISMDKKNPKLYEFRASTWRELGHSDYESRAKQDYRTAEKLRCTNKYEELNMKSYSSNNFTKIMFRIYDYGVGQLFPTIADTISLYENDIKTKCKGIENVELKNKLILYSISVKNRYKFKNGPNKRYYKLAIPVAVYTNIELMNDTANKLFFGFYRVKSYDNKKTIIIKKGSEQMTLLITGYPSGSPCDILLDSIPFKNGIVTIDVSKFFIIKKSSDNLYQTEINKGYNSPDQIKGKIIRDFYTPPYDMQNYISVEMFYNHWLLSLRKQNFSTNDTTFYYYCDSLPNLFCKGVYKEFRTVTKRKKIYITDPGFDEPPRRKVFKRQHRYGEWKYYDINGNILLESHYKKKKAFALKNNRTVPTGIWKYYDNGTLIMKEIYKPKNRVEVIRY